MARPKLDLDQWRRVTRESYDRWKAAVAKEWQGDPLAQRECPDVLRFIEREFFVETGTGVSFQSEAKSAHPMAPRSGGLSPEENSERLFWEDERRSLLRLFDADPERFAKATGRSSASIRAALEQRPKSIDELRAEIADAVCRPEPIGGFTDGSRIELLNPARDCLTLSATGAATLRGREFEGIAYSGAMVPTKRGDLVLDVGGIALPPGKFAAFREHDHKRIIGYIENAAVRDGELHVRGKLLSVTQDGRELVGFADNGFDELALSIGFDVLESKRIEVDTTVFVNRQALAGPFTLVTKSRLNEISFVSVPADQTAHAIVG